MNEDWVLNEYDKAVAEMKRILSDQEKKDEDKALFSEIDEMMNMEPDVPYFTVVPKPSLTEFLESRGVSTDNLAEKALEDDRVVNLMREYRSL